MTSFVIANLGDTELIVNGIVLPVSSCRGLLTPATIEGNGSFSIVCNPTRGEKIVVTDPELGDMDFYLPAAPVSVRLYDTIGDIVVVPENVRYPEEGGYPLLRTVHVV
mgnify:CR=1 FL=1